MAKSRGATRDYRILLMFLSAEAPSPSAVGIPHFSHPHYTFLLIETKVRSYIQGGDLG